MVGSDRVAERVFLKRPLLFVCREQAFTLLAGEEAEYFRPTDTYVFKERGGVCPFYPRAVVTGNPRWFGLV